VKKPSHLMQRNILIKLTSTLLVFSLNGISHISSVYANITREAASIDETVSGMIRVWGPGASEYGEDELYDVKITILEVLRGKEAWERLQSASTSNQPAKDAFEFVLARIRFEYHARGMPGNKSYTIQKDDFKVYSKDNRAYEGPRVLPPKPGLVGRILRPGDSCEGWVPFLVEKEDKKPFIFFSGGMWFQLF